MGIKIIIQKSFIQLSENQSLMLPKKAFISMLKKELMLETSFS